ncbi:ankyrin repeat-containing domain protein [Xylaria cf. heliscus]|nr:ankyrin repeat-containing domain protein [Xylaria cf. heliscus]
MSDPLSILGGLSASGQILSSIVKAVVAISVICENFRDAPRHFVRIKDRLTEVHDILNELKAQTQNLTDDDFLPRAIRERLHSVVATILHEVGEVQKYIPQQTSITGRLKWATFRKKLSAKPVKELDQAEASLFKIIQFLTYRNTIKLVVEGRQRQQRARRDQATPVTADVSSPALREINFFVLNSDSLWRWLGFSGAFSCVKNGQGGWRSRLSLGFQPPCSWVQSVQFQLSLANRSDGTSGIRITSGHLYLQDRISSDHPFMIACRNGDIALMRQCLDDQPWAMRSRCITTGETPLILAIRGESLEAVKWLLERGANPDDGDDDQILPIFAALEMKAPGRSRFLQQAPRWKSWFECVRTLASYNASIHEVVHGKTLGMLSVFSHYRNSATDDHTLDYIHFLRSEHYVDFDTVDRQGWSTLGLALQSPTQGLKAIQVLQGLGVNLSRILDDGRSYLCIALEATKDITILQHIYENGCAPHLNRQDQWGWTPLHYCIFAESGGSCNSGLPKLRFLLEKGAKTEPRAGHHRLIPIFGLTDFTPIELADHLEQYQPKGVGAMLRAYVHVEEKFYDAVAFPQGVRA